MFGKKIKGRNLARESGIKNFIGKRQNVKVEWVAINSLNKLKYTLYNLEFVQVQSHIPQFVSAKNL